MPSPPFPFYQLYQQYDRLAPGSVLAKAHNRLTDLSMAIKGRWTRVLYCKVQRVRRATPHCTALHACMCI